MKLGIYAIIIVAALNVALCSFGCWSNNVSPAVDDVSISGLLTKIDKTCWDWKLNGFSSPDGISHTYTLNLQKVASNPGQNASFYETAHDLSTLLKRGVRWTEGVK